MKKNIKDTVDQFHDYDIYLPSRTITAFSLEEDQEKGESGVDSGFAKRIIKNLVMLESVSSDPITIILNTPGGDWYQCMALYDVIKECKSHVTIKGSGQIMSAGPIILQAADTRLLYPNSKVMIHYGDHSVSNSSVNFERWAEEMKSGKEDMERILLEKIKEKLPEFKASKIKSMLEHDTIFSAREAVNLGLADGIVGEYEEEEDGS